MREDALIDTDDLVALSNELMRGVVEAGGVPPWLEAEGLTEESVRLLAATHAQRGARVIAQMEEDTVFGAAFVSGFVHGWEARKVKEAS